MGEEKNILELPRIDLNEAGRVGPGTEAWAAVQAEVAQALLEYGGFEAVYGGIVPELQDELMRRALPEVFMDEARFSSAPALPSNGWLLQMQGFAFKSLQIQEPDSPANVEEYARSIWPQGNEFFCNTICNYATHLQGLARIIYTMILKSLDLEHHFDSHMRSASYSMRLSHYFKDLPDDGTQVGMPPHVDSNYLNIICPHDVAGLEIEASNGGWIRVAPRRDSFIVLIGECFMAWTNERFRAPKHRVRMDGTKERYSLVFCSLPSRKDDVVKTMDELVDKKHPLIYKPYKYYDYLSYRFASEDLTDALKAYCGVEQQSDAT